jgi:hypothetical protein
MSGWDGVTADVEAILGEREQQVEDRGLPKWKRNQKARDKERTKVTIDFSKQPGLVRRLYGMAEQEHVGISSLVVWLLVQGLARVREKGVVVPKRASRSLKHSFDVRVETVDGRR